MNNYVSQGPGQLLVGLIVLRDGRITRWEGSLMLILFAAFLSPRNRREFDTLSGLRYDGAVLKRLLRFGIPCGIEFFLTLAALNLFVLMFHAYGRDEAAAINAAGPALAETS